MKKLIFGIGMLAIASTVMISSCKKKEVSPGATANPTTTLVGNPVVFTDSKTERENSTIAWDFGDGTHSSDMNPSNIYWTPGTYTASQMVTLYKNANKGKGKTEASTVKITVTGPTAAFSASATTVMVNEPVTLTNSSTDAKVYRWTWVSSNGQGASSWDGGISYSKENLVLSFSEAGTYTVYLWADIMPQAPGQSASVATPVVITVNGGTSANANAVTKGKLVGIWTVTHHTEALAGNGSSSPFACSGINIADHGATERTPGHSTITFYQDGTLRLIDSTSTSATNAGSFMGNWALDANGTYLTLKAGAGVIGQPTSFIDGIYTFTVTGSALDMTMIVKCNTAVETFKLNATK